jgi:hypothetical protein
MGKLKGKKDLKFRDGMNRNRFKREKAKDDEDAENFDKGRIRRVMKGEVSDGKETRE